MFFWIEHKTIKESRFCGWYIKKMAGVKKKSPNFWFQNKKSATNQPTKSPTPQKRHRVMKPLRWKPLGVGETLGCTSPKVGDVDAVGSLNFENLETCSFLITGGWQDGIFGNLGGSLFWYIGEVLCWFRMHDSLWFWIGGCALMTWCIY